MRQYSYRVRRPNPLQSTLTSGVAAESVESESQPTAPPARQSEENLQAVLDQAHEQGILEEPADASEAREQGVTAARIDTVEGESVLVERVESKKPRRKRKAKA